jgi:hypothetical protein
MYMVTPLPANGGLECVNGPMMFRLDNPQPLSKLVFVIVVANVTGAYR